MHSFAVKLVNDYIDDILMWHISACFELKVITVFST